MVDLLGVVCGGIGHQEADGKSRDEKDVPSVLRRPRDGAHIFVREKGVVERGVVENEGDVMYDNVPIFVKMGEDNAFQENGGRLGAYPTQKPSAP